jgi:hypothetical protein
MVGVKHMVIDELGQAMRALTEKQRRFVLAYCEYPHATGTDLARMAGYAQKEGSRIWSKTASKMLRDPGIIAAIHEVLSKTYRGRGAAIAQDVMLTIAKDRKHPKQLQAALALADRGGFAAAFEQKLTVEHRDQTSEAILGRISLALKRLGLDDPVRLAIEQKLGKPMETIDVDPDAGPANQRPALAGPEGRGAAAGSLEPEANGNPASPELADNLPVQPQQQAVRGDQ